MGYVSGGDFKNDLEAIFGPLKKKKTDLGKKTFDQLEDDDVRKEVDALFKLRCTFDLPELCGLNWSYFISIADSYGADEDELMDDWGAAPGDAELFIKTIEIFNDTGNPFITVGDDGVCMAFDDPFEIGIWYDDFEIFLQFLVNLTGAAEGVFSYEEVQAEYADEIETAEGELFLERSERKAKAANEDAKYEEALENDTNGETSFDPTGLSFLFTGKLASMKRAEAQSRVKEIGGDVAKSVNKNLDILVIGDDGSPLYGEGAKGSKQKKAEGLIADGAAIRIISESAFLKL